MTMPAPCISGKCVVLQAGQDFRFSNFWRQTFVRSCVRGQGTFSARREFRVKHMYSDVLYSSWHWAHAKLRPEWLDGDTIPRIAASELSLQRFINEFEQPNRPVIITGLVRIAAILSRNVIASVVRRCAWRPRAGHTRWCSSQAEPGRGVHFRPQVDQWPAMALWTDEYLRKAFEGRKLNAGGCMLSWDHWQAYSAGSRSGWGRLLLRLRCTLSLRPRAPVSRC